MSDRKNTVCAYIMSAVFVAFLVLPTVLYPFIKGYFDTANYENRELSEKPEFAISDIETYPENYEAYFNDHLPFKNQFTKLNAWVDLNVFKSLTSDKVILGKDNWLFYKSVADYDPLGCYQGTNLLTEEELQEYAQTLTQTAEKLKNEGKTFVLMLSPAKEQIYSEYMPKSIKVFSDFSRCDQLYAYLVENTDLKVVYPYAEMLDYKDKYQLYHKYDTHWNSLGSFIGEQQLLETLTGKRLYLEDIKYSYKGEGLCDLATLASLNGTLEKESNIVIEDYQKDVTSKLVEISEDGYFHSFTSDSPNTQKFLLLGDSFRSEMINHMPDNFAETNFLHYSTMTPEKLNEINSDIVVLEVAERYVPRIEELCGVINESLS